MAQPSSEIIDLLRTVYLATAGLDSLRRLLRTEN